MTHQSETDLSVIRECDARTAATLRGEFYELVVTQSIWPFRKELQSVSGVVHFHSHFLFTGELVCCCFFSQEQQKKL